MARFGNGEGACERAFEEAAAKLEALGDENSEFFARQLRDVRKVLEPQGFARQSALVSRRRDNPLARRVAASRTRLPKRASVTKV